MTTQLLTVIDGTPRVSSIQVANHFNKNHKHILRDIRKILTDCPADFNKSNFGLINNSVDLGHTTRQDPAYSMTRDGFTLLAMGFTGKEALQWKIKYIEAFNAMEAALAAQARDSFQLKRDVSPRALGDLSTIEARSRLRFVINVWADTDFGSRTIIPWRKTLVAFGYKRAADIPLSQLDAICDWVQDQVTNAALVPAPPAPKPAAQADPEMLDTLYKAKVRALENTKKINQLYLALNELDSRCFDDYRTLDRAEMSFRGLAV